MYRPVYRTALALQRPSGAVPPLSNVGKLRKLGALTFVGHDVSPGHELMGAKLFNLAWRCL